MGLSEAGGTRSRWPGLLSGAQRKVMAMQGGGLLCGVPEKAAKSHKVSECCSILAHRVGSRTSPREEKGPSASRAP